MNFVTGPRALVLILALPLCGVAQGLLFSPHTPADRNVGVVGLYDPNDLALQDVAGPLRRFFDERNLDVLLGDLDGDGELNDAPSRIDAITTIPGLANDPVGVALSFSTNFNALDGTLIRDGDVVRLLGGGVIDVVVSEADLSMATGTGAIDVDAFHIGSNGDFFVSFSEDETTTSPALIAANGGSASLDEASVFRIAPDGTAALFLTRDDVIALAANATGTGITSVVDTQGLTADPSHAGELLLTFGSANDDLEGRVFSTAGGGSLFSVNGLAFDSVTFGFDALEILGGLAWLEAPPPTLALHHPDDIGADPGTANLIVSNLTPGNTARLALSDTRFPADPVFSGGFSGRDSVLIDPTHPFLLQSLSDPLFSQTADAGGVAYFSYDVAALPPGLALTIQAFEVETLILSPAIATLVMP